ncbi:MAG: transposase [Alphaproteobacteria bacterium]|jgi:hypothetical protein|nr:transposase [Alphaproteobacteria bacterium]
MVEQLVRDFLHDAIDTSVDFSRMKRVSARFHGDKGERREGDVIWRLPLADGTEFYLCLMIEFQSQSDPWMALRAQAYQALLWQELIRETPLKPGDSLPPVLLVVLYNGGPRWSAPIELSDLIALTKGSPLWRWQPAARYHLLDIGAFSDDFLARRRDLTALLFRLERRQEPETLAPLIDEVIGWFRQHPGYEELKRLFTELVTRSIEGVGVQVAIPADLKEIKTMLETLGQTWREQWKAEGRNEGRNEGRTEGRTEGRAEGLAHALLLQLERRFGPLPDEVRVQVAAADTETLERWLGRVLEAPTLAAVLDGTPE